MARSSSPLRHAGRPTRLRPSAASHGTRRRHEATRSRRSPRRTTSTSATTNDRAEDDARSWFQLPYVRQLDHDSHSRRVHRYRSADARLRASSASSAPAVRGPHWEYVRSLFGAGGRQVRILLGVGPSPAPPIPQRVSPYAAQQRAYSLERCMMSVMVRSCADFWLCSFFICSRFLGSRLSRTLSARSLGVNGLTM